MYKSGIGPVVAGCWSVGLEVVCLSAFLQLLMCLAMWYVSTMSSGELGLGPWGYRAGLLDSILSIGELLLGHLWGLALLSCLRPLITS